VDAHHHAPATIEQRLVHVPILAGAHFFQIMAGTESLARSGNDHDAHGFIRGDLVQFFL
jgi:hypothetical protein